MAGFSQVTPYSESETATAFLKTKSWGVDAPQRITLTVVSGKEHIMTMRPTDTTRTCACPAKQSHITRSYSTCQAVGSPSVFPGSGGFLLLNFKSPHRDNFALSLRLHRRKVIVPEEQGRSYSNLTEDEIRNADYLYCDLTRKPSHDEFQKLRRICNLQKRDGMPLFVACWILEEKDNEGFQRTVEKFFGARIVLCKKPLT